MVIWALAYEIGDTFEHGTGDAETVEPETGVVDFGIEHFGPERFDFEHFSVVFDV